VVLSTLEAARLLNTLISVSAERTPAAGTMSTETEAEKAIRVIPFNGKHEDWRMWSRKFMARADAKGYKIVLLGNVEVPKDSDNIGEDQVKANARKLNKVAYNDLLLSCNDEVSFGAVDEAVTNDLPNGDAAQAWKNLLAKFEPTTSGNLIMLRKEFTASKLEQEDRDPDDWIADLERLRQRLKNMKAEILDRDFMIHILNNLPSAYSTVVEQLEDDLGNETNPLTIARIRDKLRIKFQRMKLSSNEGSNEETALTAQYQGKFKGRCRVCGKIGHKGADCWENNKKKGTKPDGKQRYNQNGNQNKSNRFNGKCNFCGIFGHKEIDCRKKKQQQNQSETANTAVEDSECVMMCKPCGEKVDADIWLGDSGASCHMTRSDEGMFDVTDINQEIKIGNGKSIRATKEGKLRVQALQKSGKTLDIVLTKVYFVPGLYCNLFSLTYAIGQGFQLCSTTDKLLQVSKGNWGILLDHRISTPNGFVLGVKFKRETDESLMMAVMEKGTKLSDVELHNKLGHPGKARLLSTAKYMGWDLIGDGDVTCEDCGLAKAHQKNVPKKNIKRSTIPAERLYLDITSVKKPSMSGYKFWAVVVDDATKCKWSFVLKKKDELASKVIPFLKDLKHTVKKIVKIIRCDNAGENKSLEKECTQQGLGIEF